MIKLTLVERPVPLRWEYAQGMYHEIDLIGFGWEIIEFKHLKNITKPQF